MNTANPNFRIFLADDDDDDRALFSKALGELPLKCDVVHFTDGIHLMAQLMIDSTILPNLIFLDINMPFMDGVACLRKIRDSEHLFNIPVVIYTSAINQKDMVLLEAMGAARYLKKPNSFNQLKTLLYRCIKPFYIQCETEIAGRYTFVLEA